MTYDPRNVEGESLQELRQFLQEELAEIARTFINQDIVILQELNVAPVRPRTGMVVLADGTNWNPGSGAGFYGYRGGSWHLLG